MATAGFTIWNERIAPVFDVAGQLLIVDERPDVAWQRLTLPEGSALDKLWFLRQQQVTILVCGAMTCSSYYAACGYGMTVYRFVAGPCDQVIDGWRHQLPLESHFPMPGCGRGKGRGQGRQRRNHPSHSPR